MRRAPKFRHTSDHTPFTYNTFALATALSWTATLHETTETGTEDADARLERLGDRLFEEAKMGHQEGEERRKTTLRRVATLSGPEAGIPLRIHLGSVRVEEYEVLRGLGSKGGGLYSERYLYHYTLIRKQAEYAVARLGSSAKWRAAQVAL